MCFTSAVRALGLPDLFDQVDLVAAEAKKRVQPGELLASAAPGGGAAAHVGPRQPLRELRGPAGRRCRRPRSPCA